MSNGRASNGQEGPIRSMDLRTLSTQWFSWHHRLREPALALACLVMSFVTGCGNFEDEIVEHAYELHTLDASPEVHATFERLIGEFNQAAGEPLLSYTRKASPSVSLISLVPGLELGTGKLGFGSRITSTSRAGISIKRRYSIGIELDRQYIQKRVPSRLGSQEDYDVRLLLFHEIGHGLGFTHAASPRDVMYADLQGSKDFASFFSRVRNRPRNP